MTQIKFDLEVAQMIINRLDAIKTDIDCKTFEINGRVAEIDGIKSLADLNQNLEDKRNYMNDKKNIMSTNIQKVIESIHQAGKEFANTNFGIVQGANKTGGELQ